MYGERTWPRRPDSLNSDEYASSVGRNVGPYPVTLGAEVDYSVQEVASHADLMGTNRSLVGVRTYHGIPDRLLILLQNVHGRLH